MNGPQIDRIIFNFFDRDPDINEEDDFLGECTQFDVKSLQLGQSERVMLNIKNGDGKFGFKITLASIPNVQNCKLVCKKSDDTQQVEEPTIQPSTEPTVIRMSLASATCPTFCVLNTGCCDCSTTPTTQTKRPTETKSPTKRGTITIDPGHSPIRAPTMPTPKPLTLAC